MLYAVIAIKSVPMTPLTDFLTRLVHAFGFLTVLPVLRKNKPHSSDALVKSMFFFTFVGFMIGFFSAAVFCLGVKYLPIRLSVLILILTPVLLSGALHLDGFADFCDGLFGGKSREDKLRIMKDSRIGTYGAIAILFLILAKWELLIEMPNRLAVFILAVTLARGAQVFLSALLPYGGLGEGISQTVAGKAGILEVSGALLFAFPMILFFGVNGFYFAGVLGIVLLVLGFTFKKVFGGVTGDMLGAANEVTELAVLGAAYLIR